MFQTYSIYSCYVHLTELLIFLLNSRTTTKEICGRVPKLFSLPCFGYSSGVAQITVSDNSSEEIVCHDNFYYYYHSDFGACSVLIVLQEAL